jgi:hypothetical protein
MKRLFSLLGSIGCLVLTALPAAAIGEEPSAAAEEDAVPIIGEASLPRGFPAPGPAPAGEQAGDASSAETGSSSAAAAAADPQPTAMPADRVVIKRYPAYRAARAEGRDSFRPLFNHIQRHDIAMTAPVEMTLQMDEENAGQPRTIDMSFLYAEPEMGQLGADERDPRVRVVDVPAMTVLSVGFFGNADAAAIGRALGAITRAREQRAEFAELQPAGPPRLLGYNSPFVPAALRYHEVQLPVSEPEESEAEEAD